MLLRAIITVSILVVCAYDVARAADRAADAPVSVTETAAEPTGEDALAPPMPSVSVGYSFSPYRTLKRVDSEQRLGKLRVATQQASISYPIIANEGRTIVALSASYQRLQLDYRSITSPMSSVQSLSATVFLTHRLNNAWSLILVAAPSYADDFEGGASADAVTLPVLGAGSYKVTDNVELGLGIGLQDVLGKPLPLPVASVNWMITERLSFTSILPLNAALTWMPIDQIGLSASVLANGANYHAAESVYGVNNPQMEYSAVTSDLGIRWFILPPLHVTVHGGYTLYRRFEFSLGRDRTPTGELELANGMVYGVDIGIGG